MAPLYFGVAKVSNFLNSQRKLVLIRGLKSKKYAAPGDLS